MLVSESTMSRQLLCSKPLLLSRQRSQAFLGKTRLLRPPFDVALGGTPSAVPLNQLPLVGEVALALEESRFRQKCSLKEAEGMVTEDILHIYNLASVPTIHPLKVRQKVEWVSKLVKKQRKDLTPDSRFGRQSVLGSYRHKSGNGKKKVNYVDVKDELFLVAKEELVPDLEKEFYSDQKSKRKMFIGEVDNNEVERQQVLRKREERRQLREEKLRKRQKKEENRIAESSETEKQRLGGQALKFGQVTQELGGQGWIIYH